VAQAVEIVRHGDVTSHPGRMRSESRDSGVEFRTAAAGDDDGGG